MRLFGIAVVLFAAAPAIAIAQPLVLSPVVWLAQAAAAASPEPSRALRSQPSGDGREAAVRAEIEERHRQEQKAFVGGDCETVVSFYGDEATIYANGRRIDSLQAFQEFCSSIPRPFRGRGGKPKINDTFHVLSDSVVYFVRTIDFAPTDDESSVFKREVVTKVWSRTDDGWKIVHFHSSVHEVSKE